MKLNHFIVPKDPAFEDPTFKDPTNILCIHECVVLGTTTHA